MNQPATQHSSNGFQNEQTARALNAALVEYMLQPENEPWLRALEFLPASVTPSGEALSMFDFLDMAVRDFPEIFERVDFSQKLPEEWQKMYADLEALNTHFGGSKDPNKDRGEEYRQLRSDPEYAKTRKVGERQLWLALTEGEVENEAGETVFLDGLGGNGTLARAFRSIVDPEIRDQMPKIITSEVDAAMVADAIYNQSNDKGEPDAKGIAAIRQFMSQNILQDDSVAGIVYAYGAHHIPKNEMQPAFNASAHVTQPGGVIVFHDFEEQSPTARWYSDGLDRHTLTKHRDADGVIVHYTEDELMGYMEKAGLEGEVRKVYDPFILEQRDNETEVQLKRRFMGYLVTMFGMEKLKVVDYVAAVDPENPEVEQEFAKDMAFMKYPAFWKAVNAQPPNWEQVEALGYNDQYWEKLEQILGQYADISPEDMKDMTKTLEAAQKRDPALRGVPMVDKFEVVHGEDGKMRAIFPRTALVAIGRVPEKIMNMPSAQDVPALAQEAARELQPQPAL